MKTKNQWKIINIANSRISYFSINSSPGRPKVLFRAGLTVLISVLIIFGIVRAGTITPPSGTPTATFYSLSEIYNFITSNTAATEASPALDFSSSLTGTHYTLTQIYNALAGLISAAQVKLGTTYLGVSGALVPSGGDATTANVLTGKTFFGGSQTDWNLQTGTMANNASFGLTCSASDQSVTAGYYSGGTLLGDADLVATKIKSGQDIFGVSGSYSGYPGSGGGLAGLTQTNCTDQEAGAGWYWFEDGNGDGDTADPEDGVCIQNTITAQSSSLVNSWNGAEQVTPNNLTAKTIVSATSNSATVADGSWVNGTNYVNHIAKVLTGTGDAINCWGRIKSVNDTTDTITVYGSWLGTDYAACATTPVANNTVAIFDDWMNDNSFIGDYSCSGSFPSGTVSYGSYPSTGANALAMADCLDGQRDLLPTEADRSVVTGTALAVDSTTLTTSGLSVNHWVGQKLKITSGLAANSYGLIESNTATVITIGNWLDAQGNAAEGNEIPSGTPDFAIVYIVPHGSYVPDAEIEGVGDDNDATSGNNGPLKAEALANWQGTRLPDSATFFGYCGYKDGSADYYETSCSSDKNYGTYGGQNGRTAECMDLANNAYEWLSEQYSYPNGRLAGGSACSYLSIGSVYSGYRFRAVFRP